ncbi:MAG: MlaE family lipid ABC transporter permease subunit [Erythrobacter sp.]|uniref:ABC transporter permease n=1 Tax=Erythrobacter sp. TaxID=1042 RepID=UPI002636A812|nr:MlaE family lipid ABC transporter permease subunit [Erythrobacter sp.]MDJ0979821.1 MlaE family lipid ABC transporter permease subunit [Erythrobacter sp.]
MDATAHYSLKDAGDGTSQLSLGGPLLVSTIGTLDREMRGALGSLGAVSRIDLSGVEEIDTVGAFLACQLASDHQADIVGASERAQRLLAAVEGAGAHADHTVHKEPAWERVPMALGQQVFEARDGFAGVVGAIGRVIIGFGNLARHPGRFPYKALVAQMEQVGVSALPIIGLMSFLIGVVIAQQGAVQLEQFGAEALTVNLVGRISLRELGVLMTAIMVAGRSGSAFAAQLGTMKLTEEIDAMRTIGISPTEVLIIPRVLACTFMMVLLGFYSSVISIIGGAVVGQLGLGIPFLTFLIRIQEVVPLHDVWVGLIKAPVFGLIIALAGCYHGMRVQGNSEEVGKRTTLAVVSAIFAVIVLDAFFAVFFTEIGWG